MIANTVVDESVSTNDDVRRLAEAGYPHGTWISARKQTQGRGRLGRKWESLPGNLFLSLLARLPPGPSWSWVPLATAVAIAETLRALDRRLEIEIKWPNDLWLDRKKVGGILCEASMARSDQSFIVIGIGMNCGSAPRFGPGARDVDQEATSLSSKLAKISVDDIRMPILGAVLQILNELKCDGSESLQLRYELLAALPAGARVSWTASDSSQWRGQVLDGVVQGLGLSGELLVLSPPGNVLRLYAEDVRAFRPQVARPGVS